MQAVVVSKNLGGYLFVFHPDGTQLAQEQTGEIIWLQLFDFNGDGIAELVTEEAEARGTGLLVQYFIVYRVVGHQIEQLWRGVAYTHKMLRESFATGTPVFEVTRGFLRFEPSGGGLPGPRLLHLVESSVAGGKVHVSRQAYLLEANSFHEIPWPDNKSAE